MRKAKNFGVESDIEFPLTLGRDFSGTIVSKGHGVGERLQLGDEVWGVIPVEQQGCHAEYVIANSSLVKYLNFKKKKKKRKKPSNLKIEKLAFHFRNFCELKLNDIKSFNLKAL